MIDYNLLHDCIEQETEALFGYITRFCQNIGYTVLVNAHEGTTFYMVCIPEKCTSKIALVAHCDTIIRKDGVDLYYEGGIMRNAQGVLGADDRAGVYGILHTLAHTDHRPLLFFTNFEETGGTGVKALCRDPQLHDWLIDHDIRLFIELDRANERDYVYYSWELPKEVHAFARDYGFKEAHGSYSDVADLTRETTIPHLNLSIGYKNQHGKAELLSLPDMMRTIAALDMMLYREPPQVYIGPEPVRTYTSYGTGYLGHGTSYGYSRGSVGPSAFTQFTAADWSLDDDEEDEGDLMTWRMDENDTWVREPKVTTSLNYNTRGSCFICMSKHMLHDELLVCQECYHRSMERR